MDSWKFFVLVGVFSLAIGSPIRQKMIHLGPSGRIISQEVSEESADNKEEKLAKLMAKHVLDNTGVISPNQLPELPGHLPVHRQQPPPERNWGRRMSERQWRQQVGRLNPGANEANKRLMHIRNSINDNRHDRHAMKIPRHSS